MGSGFIQSARAYRTGRKSCLTFRFKEFQLTTKTASFSLTIALMTLSGISQATSAWHQGNGDVVHVTPEHIGQNTARSPMEPNIHAKMLHGDLMPLPLAQASDTATPAGKSRQQVAQELLDQSANERGRMKNLYAN